MIAQASSAGLVLAWLTHGAIALLALAILLSCVRLVKGPTRADQAVVVDLISLLAAGILGVYAIATDEPVYVDVAIVVVVINFMVTVGIARFLERTGLR